jgi:hypothetical protein
VHPSFETRARGALLRMRLKGEAFISGRRLMIGIRECTACRVADASNHGFQPV